MITKSTASLIFMLMFAQSSYADNGLELNPKYRGFSIARNICQDFTNTKDNESVIIAYKLWFGGYLSSVNSLLGGKKDILSGKDMNYVIDWVSGYCEANPSTHISEVADYFVSAHGR